MMKLNDIIEKIGDKEIYSHYFGIDVLKKQKVNIVRPSDKNCSFRIKQYADGRYRWKDFGSIDSSGDSLDLMQIVFGLSLPECMRRISDDYEAMLFDSSNKIVINSPDIGEIPKAYSLDVILNKHDNIPLMTKVDLKYWNERYITKKILQKEHVYSVHAVLYNDEPIMSYHKKNPIFMYIEKVDDKLYKKIYRPLANEREIKWISDISNAKRAIGGIDSMMNEDYLIITKSKKDYMIMKYILGFNTVYVQSESTGINADLMNQLWNRYKTIYSLFDNDKPGLEMGVKFCKENDTIPIFFDERYGKDTDQVIVKHGINLTKELIKSML